MSNNTLIGILLRFTGVGFHVIIKKSLIKGVSEMKSKRIFLLRPKDEYPRQFNMVKRNLMAWSMDISEF